ncbi:hypothetical protein [uncultured Roseivirga sp.]|uniref:hypothetical protein n=1 Tax=uncultured Roseivirga sp. TaxID=543088 RepID=UPI0030D87A4A
MKKNLKSLLSVLGLVAFFIVALTFKVKSQDPPPPPPCEGEVVAVSGTKMTINPNDPWIYECMGAFTNCTDVFVIGCREEQE